MRVLLLGGTGMLGRDLHAALRRHYVEAPTRADLPLTDHDALKAAAAGMDVVINAAAYTAVDAAEDDVETAMEVNAVAAGAAAGAASLTGARFVQISTDYVFDGMANEPYPEDTALHPQNAYGRSKAAGELAVATAHPAPLIVRTAWLYGAHGANFARAILTRARTQETIDVVDDQRGQPTWTADLADAVVRLLEAEAPAGAYHGTNAGEATWFDFAGAVFEAVGLDPGRLRPVASDAFPRRATRPAYSVLGHDGWRRAGLSPLRGWRDALTAAARSGMWDTA